MRFARLSAILMFMAAVLLVGPSSIGQDKKAKNDPQSKFEPRSNPGVGQKFLEKFVGDWDVVKTFHPRKGKAFVQKGE